MIKDTERSRYWQTRRTLLNEESGKLASILMEGRAIHTEKHQVLLFGSSIVFIDTGFAELAQPYRLPCPTMAKSQIFKMGLMHPLPAEVSAFARNHIINKIWLSFMSVENDVLTLKEEMEELRRLINEIDFIRKTALAVYSSRLTPQQSVDDGQALESLTTIGG